MTPKRREALRRLADYAQFERIALGCVLVILSAISIYAIVALVIKLSGDSCWARHSWKKRRSRTRSAQS